MGTQCFLGNQFSDPQLLYKLFPKTHLMWESASHVEPPFPVPFSPLPSSSFVGNKFCSHRSLSIPQYIVLRQNTLGAPKINKKTQLLSPYKEISYPFPPEIKKKKTTYIHVHLHTCISFSCFSLQRSSPFKVMVNNA